ncbi:craniofacial development protein 1 isoform X1 [Juglans microcarpa x Juglans regia]|uniref:craniofacial development protein 1 isoform X1 n=2 Tax=Juglans microcarpa x Juglans regia TaxID=2249226 RepID=UPI001B7DD135|nr:craniofacial development protein 1 isoform X1 [Juglans microcarpa x Juglans regia]
MATTNGSHTSGTGTLNERDGVSNESAKATDPTSKSETKPEENEIKARVDAMWEQMNKGVPTKTLKSFPNKRSSSESKKTKKSSKNWMAYLGLAPNTGSLRHVLPHKEPSVMQDSTSDEAKRLAAAAALSAVKDATAIAAGWGKVEITEVRDFAGQEIEVKKLVDADSKEASEKAKGPAPSAVDAVLEQIKKKQKLSVLDKTKQDWGEFKEENKGLEDELDAYKKSSNQYLEKVSFLQRTDYREFERERDARLALQARRKPDMREDL